MEKTKTIQIQLSESAISQKTLANIEKLLTELSRIEGVKIERNTLSIEYPLNIERKISELTEKYLLAK